MNMFVVKNKVAVVFGGNGGIGKCTVLELFKHGIKSVLIVDSNDVNVDSFIQNEIISIYGENKVKFMICDVTNLTQVQNVFDFCIQQFGVLDIVINCVGIISEENTANTITINLIGATHIINEAYSRLPKCKSAATEQAVICSVSSTAGLNPLHLFPSYSASKSGLITFSHCMAKKKELEGDLSVKIVTLCPTATDTSMLNVGRQMCKVTTGDAQKNLIKLFHEDPAQKPESAAKCLLDIIQNGDNGSFWLSDRDRNAKRINYEAIPSLLNLLD